MAELKGKLRVGAEHVSFWCPGCDEPHRIRVAGAQPWAWNQSCDKPTFHPSVLVSGGHYAPGWQGPHCWCTYDREHPETPSGFKCDRCHSWVKEGKITFLADSTHALAGKTVDLPEYPS